MKKNSFQRLAEEASLETRFERTVDRRYTPSLQQRTLMLLRALHEREDYSDEEFRAARNKILEKMAEDVLRDTTRNDPSTGLRPDTTLSGRGEAVQYSKGVYSSRSVDFSARDQVPHLDVPRDASKPLASQASPKAERPNVKDMAEGPLFKRKGASRIFHLPTLTGWQWSGLGTAVAATAVIAVFGFQYWQTQLQSEKGFQIAMVTIEDRSVLFDSQARRTRGRQQSTQSSENNSSEKAAGGRFQEIEVPTALLRRAIASTLTDKMATGRSELMNYLRAHSSAFDSRSQILIDADLAARVSQDAPDVTRVRAYDLNDPHSASIRNEIKMLVADSRAVLLTLGR
jgi:hypothetical protein